MNKNWINLAIQLAAVLAALLFTTLILLAVQAPPLEAYKNIINGIFPLEGDSAARWAKFSDVLISWVPLIPHGRAAHHFCRWPVEYRHRRPDYAGGHLHHLDDARPARFQPAACPHHHPVHFGGYV